MAEQEPWDELMGPPPSHAQKHHRNSDSDDEPTLSTSTSSSSYASSSRMPSRWAQYEKDSEQLRTESHEANCKAVELAADKIANSPPRSAERSSVSLPIEYESQSDDGSDEEYGFENDEAQIRLEALKMLELADDHLSTPYAVRKTQTGGFSASYSGSFSGTGSLGNSRRSSGSSEARRVPRALAGLDFSKRATARTSYTSSPRSDYGVNDLGTPFAEQESLVDVIEMDDPAPKKESRWSSRYSIDHTLLALSGGRSRSSNAKDVLDQLERETDREIKSARNMFVSSPHETPRMFGSGGFSFRDGFRSNASRADTEETQPISPSTNLRTAWIDAVSSGLDTNGKSLEPPEPRKTWQEQVERKKRQQRRLAMVSLGLCITIAVLIGVVSGSGGKDDNSKASAFSDTAPSRGTPEVVFYVTSDSPYDSSEEQKLSADLQVMPDAEFVVHLGNIQDSSVTLCSESRYARVKDVLVQSPVPMFILPGEEDWNNCPNPENAWETWESTFDAFETNFDHNFVVSRQMRRKENFSFLYKKVLFMGFHLVGGRIHGADDWDARLEDNVNWMESMVTMNQDNFQYVVMMGNARPGPQQRKFFDRLSAFLGPYDLPIIYVHANSGVGGVMKYDLFGGDQGIEALQIEDGGINPPLRISIFDGEAPFVVG